MKVSTLAVLLTSLLVLSASGACPNTSSYTLFSSLVGWNVAGANINITAGSSVLVDKTAAVPIGLLRVSGLLFFKNTNMELQTRGILVNSGGSLVVGTSSCPITSKVKITLCGTSSDFASLGSDPAPGTPVNTFGGKGIAVATGGSIEMYGATSGPMWTFLSDTAWNGTKTLKLRDAVQWQVGDQIVLASTDYSEVLSNKVNYNYTAFNIQARIFTMTGAVTSPEQSENFTIAAVSADKKSVTLDRSVSFTHWGAGYQRAEVGLLTRNIVVRGDDSSEVDGFGGHLLMRKGPVTKLYGVEFTRMGQKMVMSRYPVHFHNMGNVTGLNVSMENCATHHLYQRCVTIHESDGVSIINTVAYYTFGHCYFIEDGGETGNWFINNLGIYAKAMFPPLLPSDVQPSMFWITNPNNSFVGNSASSAYIAYWMVMPVRPTGPFGHAIWDSVPWMKPREMSWGAGGFVNNIGHSIFGDTFHIDMMLNDDGSLSTGGWSPNKGFDVVNLLSYKTRHGAVWSRFATGRYFSNVYMDFGNQGSFMTDGQSIYDSLFVGESDNLGYITQPAMGRSNFDRDGKWNYVGGYRGYDNGGTQTLVNCTFMNFTYRPERGAGGLVNSDNGQFGTFPLNKLFNATYINAVSHWANSTTLDNTTANGFAYQDGDGISLGMPGGAWLLGNQSFFDTIPECVRKIESNGYLCKPFARGLVEISVLINASASQAIEDGKVWGYHNKNRFVLWRPLGSAVDGPFIFNEWKGPVMNQRFWTPLVANGAGKRVSMSPHTETLIRSGGYGDWAVIVLPYPKGTTFRINVPGEENVMLKMATSIDGLTPYNPYYDSNQQFLYLYMTNENAGVFTNNTGAGYNRAGPYVRGSYDIDASCPQGDCRVQGNYTVPAVPTVLPTCLRHNTFVANLKPVSSSMSKHKGTFFGQLYPFHWSKIPTMSLQLWHSVFGNQSDLYLSIVDKNNKMMADNLVGHSTFTGNFRVTYELWKAMVEGRVFISIRRMISDEEVLRGQLVIDPNQTVLTPPPLMKSSFTCDAPSYAHKYIYQDKLQGNFTLRGTKFNESYTVDKMCGNSSLSTQPSGGDNFWVALNPSNCGITNTLIESQYKSIEYFIKTSVPYQNNNLINISISGQVVLPNKTLSQTIYYPNYSNMANVFVNRHNWTLVRVNLDKIGGRNLSCLNFQFRPWQSTMGIFMDNIRFSSLDDSTSFYDLTAVPTTTKAAVTTTTKVPVVGAGPETDTTEPQSETTISGIQSEIEPENNPVSSGQKMTVSLVVLSILLISLQL